MKKIGLFTAAALLPLISFASEADLKIPELKNQFFANVFSGSQLLWYSSIIILLGLLFGIVQYLRIKKLPVHYSMLEVSETIYATCKTYLIQQGRFLAILLGIIAVIIFYYFFFLSHMSVDKVLLVLMWTVLGIAGSYGVAWFGIRINTLANSRTSFASLRGRPWDVVSIPLQAGMSVGLLLISVELIMMLIILLVVPGESAGACFVGFAIGESLGASALRIAGGIFTKIADIGADLMKVFFSLPEDDPRNPGVIADCTGDNAGDSIGPTADGFETYGVTGVALISFIVLAVTELPFQSMLIVWIFMMRILMVFTSVFSYSINHSISSKMYGKSLKFNFEEPLTRLIWITSLVSILVTYTISYFLLKDLTTAEGQPLHNLWWQLSTIISCGTLAAAIIPEFTKVFTSSRSRHVNEIVNASREGGASLTILSGMVAGNFSAFWKGMVMAALMLLAFSVTKTFEAPIFGEYPAIFAFGLVAFGFLGMGPVTIAVDSYGPVTDNAQSVFELSRIESRKGISEEIQRDYGFNPDFTGGKHYLESNDSAGNTFKATAKPVLIGTAVIGATTMIFAIILILKKFGLLALQLTDPMVVLGFISGGAVIYWFSGASMQAVTTGAYRAVEYIKKNIRLDKDEASVEDSKEVVRICTRYAQYGMWNIFGVVFSLTLAFSFFDPNFFVSYLISIAVFGLFQAIYMANAGGAWDNAKKVVEVDLKQKGTDLHAATVIGDTVGDPYKDTSSVALNPIIKFSTLFGLLAAEISIHMTVNARETGTTNYSPYIGIVFLIIGLFFVYRSFYHMRIKK
ncbi:MAG: K(+)-stimulated pyrophosphate-energized sodium pump [Bacteroidales bacterium]|nr:K(+)-stimulated pyrophosphate-energized sodium pump [Bacteroidales bacterium]NLH51740.1 sodium-translocating pyrophosphatase [Bacteroidales bacterium]NPV35169.1 sodium-translocating pyrophosphatase [Bacteroidales bacterium]